MIEGTVVERQLCWSAIYLLVAVMACALDTPWPCPQYCQCNASVFLVNCSERQFATVPDGLPQDSQLLNLTYNNIKTLGRQQFPTLMQLLDLDLSNNILVMVEAEAFLGLHSLLTLRLARNQLKIIPAGAFTGLTRLQLLDMSDNKILVLVDFTFRDLTCLQKIEADDNDLVFISPHAFAGLSALKTLHLGRSNLSTVPTEALMDVGCLTRLFFHRFGLTTLPNNSFRNLGRLKELIFSHCLRLETLAENSLVGLNLTSLTITHCNVSTVPYAPLRHLVYLVHLDLSFNPISHIQGNLLRDLLRLQELHLVGGRLLSIEVQAFHGLARLNLLNVSGNLLTTLEEGVFHSVDSLKTLRLDSNLLACDCRLLWVARRHQYLNFGRHPPVCNSPLPLQGRILQDFSESELPNLFTCRQPKILNRKPQDTQVDEGHTVLFHCSADGDPTPSISWLNPQLVPLTSVGRVRVLTNGSLDIRYAQAQDSGTYLCVAVNTAGRDSFQVSLQVRGSQMSSQNNIYLDSWFPFPSSSPRINSTQHFPFEIKTLVIAVTMGFICFLSSVAVCFILVFLWSKGKGQLKHTAEIAYVPRSIVKEGNTSSGKHGESNRFTMKLI